MVEFEGPRVPFEIDDGGGVDEEPLAGDVFGGAVGVGVHEDPAAEGLGEDPGERLAMAALRVEQQRVGEQGESAEEAGLGPRELAEERAQDADDDVVADQRGGGDEEVVEVGGDDGLGSEGYIKPERAAHVGGRRRVENGRQAGLQGGLAEVLLAGQCAEQLDHHWRRALLAVIVTAPSARVGLIEMRKHDLSRVCGDQELAEKIQDGLFQRDQCQSFKIHRIFTH